MYKRALTLAACLLVAGCGEKVRDAPVPGSVMLVPQFEWRVADQATLERVYAASGAEIGAGRELVGFVGKLADGSHVVYTLPPVRVDDDVACTLGHEVMHIVLGEFHTR